MRRGAGTAKCSGAWYGPGSAERHNGDARASSENAAPHPGHEPDLSSVRVDQKAGA